MSGRPVLHQPCIIVNANGEGLETRLLLFLYVYHFLVDFCTNRVWWTSGTEIQLYVGTCLLALMRDLSHSYSPSVSCYPLQVIASAHMDTEKAAAVSSNYVALVYSHLHDNWYVLR